MTRRLGLTLVTVLVLAGIGTFGFVASRIRTYGRIFASQRDRRGEGDTANHYQVKWL